MKQAVIGQRVRKAGVSGTVRNLRGHAKRDGIPRFAFVEWDGDDGWELERISNLESDGLACCGGGPQWGHAWECPQCHLMMRLRTTANRERRGAENED